MTYTFRDTFQEITITFMAESIEAAWEDLCNNYGTGYVFENIEEVSANN